LSAEITPNEILQKKFAHSLKGYRPEEVNDFLKLVAGEFEGLLREKMLLDERVKHLEEALVEYREMEGTLKNTLISSQRVGQEIKEEAERKSDLLMRETELEANQLVDKARRRKDRIEEETFRLLTQHKRFRAEFLALMETHGSLLSAQDSRMLLEYGPEDPGSPFLDSSTAECETGENEPAAPDGELMDDPEILQGDSQDDSQDMESLFPEEKQ
jgi:cell division initiation protein